MQDVIVSASGQGRGGRWRCCPRHASTRARTGSSGVLSGGRVRRGEDELSEDDGERNEEGEEDWRWLGFIGDLIRGL